MTAGAGHTRAAAPVDDGDDGHEAEGAVEVFRVVARPRSGATAPAGGEDGAGGSGGGGLGKGSNSADNAEEGEEEEEEGAAPAVRGGLGGGATRLIFADAALLGARVTGVVAVGGGGGGGIGGQQCFEV